MWSPEAQAHVVFLFEELEPEPRLENSINSWQRTGTYLLSKVNKCFVVLLETLAFNMSEKCAVGKQIASLVYCTLMS